MIICTSDHSSVRLLTTHPDRFARQGAVVASWRTYRGRRLGPYYRLTWRADGRQRSIYLGRQGPLVCQVRRLLQRAQAPLREKREIRRRIAWQQKNLIRPIKRYLDQMCLLFGNGLYLKGWELRGIKRAGPRLGFHDVPDSLIPEFPLPPIQALATPIQPNTSPKPERSQQTSSSRSSRRPRAPEFRSSVDQ